MPDLFPRTNPLASYPLALLERWTALGVISIPRFVEERDRRLAAARCLSIETACLGAPVFRIAQHA